MTRLIHQSIHSNFCVHCWNKEALVSIVWNSTQNISVISRSILEALVSIVWNRTQNISVISRSILEALVSIVWNRTQNISVISRSILEALVSIVWNRTQNISVISRSILNHWSVFCVRLSKVSANRRKRYMCNAFSHWLKPCSATDRNHTLVWSFQPIREINRHSLPTVLSNTKLVFHIR